MVSPAVSRTLRYLAGIQDDDEPAPAPTQPSFAPEDYSSSVIAPPPPPAPTFAAPFQDEAPPPSPPPVRDDYRTEATAGGYTVTGAQPGGGATNASGQAAASTAQTAPAVPPPQYTGPSYAQPRLAPGQPSTLEQVSNVVAGAGRGVVEGAQAGLAAADQALTGPKVTPPTWEDPLAPVREVGQHIREHPLSVLPAAIYGEAQGAATDPIGRRAVEAAGGGTDPLFEATVPESVPWVGGAHIAPSAQDVGGFAAQAVLDPFNYVGAAGAGLAGRGLRHVAAEAARGLPLVGESEALLRGGARAFRGMPNPVAGLRGAVAGNAERLAAADARMAEQGSTAAPGVFGLSGIEPGRPEVQGMRPRIIPPDVADNLDFPIRLPEDPAVIRAIEAAGGTVDERGTTLNVIRMSDPEAAGGTATRSSVFYTAGPPGSPSPYAREGTVGPQGVGGQQRIEGRTRFRNPLFISDAPGEARGFDDAMQQMGAVDPPGLQALEDRVREAHAALAEANQRSQAAAKVYYRDNPDTLKSGTLFSDSPEGAAMADEIQRLADVRKAAIDEHNALREQYPSASAANIEAGIRAAKRAGPAGSPERAQALKDLVSKYGGDPDVIDDLIALRGETLGESVYAVKENIVAGNARRAGHDGVITLKQGTPDFEAINTHPRVVAAEAAERRAAAAADRLGDAHTQAYQQAIYEELGLRPGETPEQLRARIGAQSRDVLDAARERAAQRPHVSKALDDWSAADAARVEAEEATRAAQRGVEAELTPREITELADPRELRNPTPGGPIARTDAEARFNAAKAAYDDALKRARGSNPPQDAWQQADAARRELFAARAEIAAGGKLGGPRQIGPPGYTLRPDIPRRTQSFAELEQAYKALQQRAATSATAAEGEALLAEMKQMEPRLMEALQRERGTTAQSSTAAPPTRGPGSEIAQASAGALTAPTARRDPLAGVNRVLGQGVVSGVTGTTGGLVNQEMNPDDPYAFAKGFGTAALLPPLAQRGARGLARLAGAAEHAGGGALASAGGLPEDLSHYRPELSREPVLPGMEPPRRVPGDAGPRISDTPNAPGHRLGNVPPSQVREPVLPGTEAPAPRPISEAAADLALSPEQRTGISPIPGSQTLPAGQTLEQALPDILHALNPPRSAREAAQSAAALPTLAQPTGPIRRLAAAISGVVSPVVDTLNAVRYAGMLSDAAGHAFNAASNALLQGVDVVTGPIAAGLDVGRTALGRTGLPYLRDLGTDRQVWLSEIGPRVTGMRTGAKVGLEAAADVMRSGVTAGEAGKMDVARPGFGTNVPGIAPAGGAVANVVDFAMEAPLRAMAAADAAFRTSAQGGHLMAEAYTSARQANGGRPPTTAMIREAAKRDDVVERALELAKRSVLQEDRAVTQAYQQFLQKTGPFGQAVSLEVPFVKTPYNVVAQGMGMTPAGLAQTYVDVRAGKSARHVEQQLARVALGTAVMGVAFSDYSMGNLTGGYPTDEKTASTLPPGWRPWSRKVEALGGTYYLPLSMLGPLALPAVVAILANQAQKEGNAPLSPAGAGAIARGVGAYAVQSSFFGGLVELSKLFDLRTSEPDFERQAERLVAQFSPHIAGGGGLGRSIQRMMGMPARDPEGVGEAMLATFPYTAGQVAPAQDVLGRPRSMGASGPAALVIRAGEERDAPVLRAFRRAGEGLPMAAPHEIRDPDTGRDRALTPPQRHRWRSAFGAELQAGWNAEGRPPDAASLQKIEAAAREAATQQALGRR